MNLLFAHRAPLGTLVGLVPVLLAASGARAGEPLAEPPAQPATQLAAPPAALRALPVVLFALLGVDADAEPASPAASTSTVPPAAAVRRWRVLTQDITLARTLERWAGEAGYRIKWDAQRNFLIGAPDCVVGSFETALQSVLGSAGIRESDYPLEACIYANTPPLVRITRQGEQARECVAP